MLISQQIDAASHLGITPRQLRNWLDEPGFPDCSAGYDVDAIRAWREANERKGSQPEEAKRKLQLALLAEKLRQSQVETKLATHKLETVEGTLIPRKGVELTAQVILSSLAEWCDQLPDLIAGILPKKHQTKVADELKRELDKRRIELAAELRALSGDSR